MLIDIEKKHIDGVTELHWGLIWLIRSNLILAAIQEYKQQKDYSFE